MNEFDRLEYQKRILDWAEPIILSLPLAPRVGSEKMVTPYEETHQGADQGVFLNNGERVKNFNEDEKER